MAKTVKIGPDMPDLPIINARETEADEAPVEQAQDVVESVDSQGNVVTTITAVARPRNETPAQVAARVKERYTDSQGNIVETY